MPTVVIGPGVRSRSGRVNSGPRGSCRTRVWRCRGKVAAVERELATTPLAVRQEQRAEQQPREARDVVR